MRKPVSRQKVAAAAAVKSRPQAAPRKEKPARPPRGGIPFICSECYEEFVLPASYSRETVSCPECLHVGKRPAEDFLRTVTLHKSGEQGSFKMAIFFTYALIVSAIFFLWVISPYSSSAVSPDIRGILTSGLGGLSVLLVCLLIWSVSRYEKNRWEIYF